MPTDHAWFHRRVDAEVRGAAVVLPTPLTDISFTVYARLSSVAQYGHVEQRQLDEAASLSILLIDNVL